MLVRRLLRGGAPFRSFSAVPNRTIRRKTAAEFKRDNARDRGYFADLNEIGKDQGRVFPRMQKLWPRNQSQLFPTLPCSSLATDPQTSTFAIVDLSPELLRGHLSLVTLSFRESGRKYLKSWQDAFDSATSNTVNSTSFEVAVIEEFLLRRVFGGFLMRNLRGKTPNASLSRTLFCFKDVIEELEQLGVRNRLAAYAFLVDRQGYVRWKSSGPCDEAQQSVLTSLIEKLDSE